MEPEGLSRSQLVFKLISGQDPFDGVYEALSLMLPMDIGDTFSDDKNLFRNKMIECFALYLDQQMGSSHSTLCYSDYIRILSSLRKDGLPDNSEDILEYRTWAGKFCEAFKDRNWDLVHQYREIIVKRFPLSLKEDGSMSELIVNL